MTDAGAVAGPGGGASYVASLGLAAAASFSYHLVLKLTPAHVHPAFALAFTYAVGLITCLVLAPFFPLRGSVGAEFARLTWHSWALGFAVVGIEFGFLWAYRVGWNPGVAGVSANALSGIGLLVVAALAFGESPSPRQIAGFFVCLVGLWLISSGPSSH